MNIKVAAFTVSEESSNSICTKVPDKLEFELITTEIQFNLKLFGDNNCRCKQG